MNAPQESNLDDGAKSFQHQQQALDSRRVSNGNSLITEGNTFQEATPFVPTLQYRIPTPQLPIPPPPPSMKFPAHFPPFTPFPTMMFPGFGPPGAFRPAIPQAGMIVAPSTRPVPMSFPQQRQVASPDSDHHLKSEEIKSKEESPAGDDTASQEGKNVSRYYTSYEYVKSLFQVGDISTEAIYKEWTDQLRNLLMELKTPKFVTYEKMLPKLTYDLRFTSIPKQHRRSCFTSALKLVRESQQKTDAKDKKIALETLQSLLKKLSSEGKIRSFFTIEDVVERFGNHPQWPNDLETKSRDSAINEVLEERRRTRAKVDEDDRQTFRQMIEEYLDKEKPSCSPRWIDTKRHLRADRRYVSVDSSERESLFMDVLKRRELKNREEAIRSRDVHRGENNTQRRSGFGQYSRWKNPSEFGHRDSKKRPRPLVIEEEESCESQRRRILDQQSAATLKLLLTERIKNPFTVPAREGFQLLERDARWSQVDRELDDHRKIEIYERFVNDLKNQRLDLLEKELSQSYLISGPNVSFSEVAELLGWETDRRFQGLPAEEVEARFIRWRRTVLEEAKSSFSTFLRTNAMVTADAPNHGPLFRKLMEELSSDPRYARLDGFGEVRDQLVIDRIKEFEKQRKETPRPIVD